MTLNQNRLVCQGLFLAPSIVSQAVKGAILFARVFEKLGFQVKPTSESLRYDIIQAIKLGNADRLIAFYDLDLAAYHEALGPDPSSVQLLGVNGSLADAAWIEPGDCENIIGYWHLPGVRFVYRQGGALKSFAVASLISWRGVWYVVHLGPNPRPENVGTVDQPASGAGTPGPPGGC